MDIKSILDSFKSNKIQAVKDTVFKLSPFAETIKIDPFKTASVLKLLTEAELAISRYTNSLSKILPKELLDFLSKSPEVTSFLKSVGTSFEKVLGDIAKIFPSNFDLGGLLKQVDFGTIVKYSKIAVGVIEGKGLDLKSLPAGFLPKVFGYLTNMVGLNISPAKLTDIANKVSALGVVFENKAVTSAVALASIDMSVSPPTNSSLLQSSGISNTSSYNPTDGTTTTTNTLSAMTDLINSSSLDQVKSIVTLSNAISPTNLVTAISDYKTIRDDISSTSGVSNADSLISSVVTIGAETITKVGDGISVLGNDGFQKLVDVLPLGSTVIGVVNNSVYKCSASNVNDGYPVFKNIININVSNSSTDVKADSLDILTLHTLSVTNAIPIKQEIDTLGIVNYKVANGENVITTLVDKYGTDNIWVLIDLYQRTEQLPMSIFDVAESIIPVLISSPIGILDKLIDLNTSFTVSEITSVITRVIDVPVTDLTYINMVNVSVGASTFDKLITLAETVLSEVVANLPVVCTGMNDQFLTIPNLTLISGVTLAQLDPVFIVNETLDVTTVVNNLGLSGVFEEYVIRNSADIYAANGMPMKAISIVNLYPSYFNDYDIKLLARKIINSYRISDDDLLIGLNIVSKNLISSLLEICPLLFRCERGNEVVMNYNIIATASQDMVRLFLLDDRTYIGATLFKNETFTR